jgi:hypothetical protein
MRATFAADESRKVKLGGRSPANSGINQQILNFKQSGAAQYGNLLPRM